MNLSGDFTVKRPRSEVYLFLTDPERFGKILPDLESLTVEGPTAFEAVVRVGISFIKGPLRVRFDLIEAEEGERARYRGKGSGIGSFVELEAEFRLKDAGDDETEVHWEGTANTGGRIASVASGLLLQIARKNADVFIQALKGEMKKRA